MARLDENFICGYCGGTLVPIGEQGDNKVYQCSNCKVGTQFECPICHNPRTIWAEDKEVCSFCSGDYYVKMAGEIKGRIKH